MPIASGIGAKDIRVVRAALEQLERAGELVTCSVIVDGQTDKEYRLAAGGKVLPRAPYVEPRAFRRPDSSAIPSHFGRAEASTAAVAGKTPHQGKVPVRRLKIIRVIETAGCPLTARDLHDAFGEEGEALDASTVHTVVREMLGAGQLVEYGKIRTRSTQILAMGYATPAIAARLKQYQMGSGGEATPAEHPVPGKASASPAAPQTAVEPLQKTAQPAAPELQANTAISALQKFDSADARTRLEIHLRANVGAWLSFRWLLPVVAGSAPDLMVLLAEYQREGKLAFGVLDYNGPMWSPVEGRW